MSAIETLAVAMGIINVALIIRRSVWNYPFGLAMVVLYGWIFLEVKLYSDMLLQGFFFVVQLYGWRNWLQHRGRAGIVIPERLSIANRILAVALTGAGALLLGFGMAKWTDAALPYWDASIAALSVTAQVLLSVRRIENWLFWIAADVVAVGVYWAKGLQLTAGLYVIFLALAITGLILWARALSEQAGPTSISGSVRQGT